MLLQQCICHFDANGNDKIIGRLEYCSRTFLILIPVKRVTVWLMEETGAESAVPDMTSQKPV